MRIPDEQKICIRNFPAGVTEEEVKEYFSSCGEVIDIYLKDNGADTFGFVGFETRESQQQALAFDGREMKENIIKIEAKRIQGARETGPRDTRDQFKVFVGGLNEQVPDDEIRSYFETNVGAVNDFYRSARSGLFAFVGFTNDADKAAALAKSGEVVSGCTLRIEAKGGRPNPRGGRGYDDYPAPSRRYDSRSPARRRYRDDDDDAPRYRRRVSRSPSPRSRRPAHRSGSPRRRYDSPSRSPPRHRRDSRSPARRRHRSRS